MNREPGVISRSMLDGCYWMCRSCPCGHPEPERPRYFLTLRATEGMEDNLHDHLPPSADSQVVKSPSATAYQLPHIQSGHRPRIGWKSSRRSPYVSSCWHYGIQSYCAHHQRLPTRASDGPEQSLARSGPSSSYRISVICPSRCGDSRLYRPLLLQHRQLPAGTFRSICG